MEEIKITLDKKINDSYTILIKQNVSSMVIDFLKTKKLGNKYAIITDSTVVKLYGFALKKFLKNNEINCEIFSFEKGEEAKKLQTIENLAKEMIEKKFDRKDAIIALGGGVCGDLAGFLASIYMRGIPFIQIPTTLLAMVDASIGGKTGVNLTSGKNLIGTFYQPKAVFIDINYLKTLSLSHIRNGLAEIIKCGVIKDKILFETIEKNLNKILKLEPNILNEIIKKSVKIKTEIVEKDEKEKDLRKILNYGHSFGHIIEKQSAYKLLHGYAISIGMIIANKIAVDKKLLKEEIAERIKNLIKNAGLPITTIKTPTIKDLVTDKKKQGNYIDLIFPTTIGKVVIRKEKINV
ncbi:MAG: 3-dehydroquinate synthase [Candidatus Gracilibacteria bacterium]|jgi:3-dehydroquinate synthase